MLRKPYNFEAKGYLRRLAFASAALSFTLGYWVLCLTKRKLFVQLLLLNFLKSSSKWLRWRPQRNFSIQEAIVQLLRSVITILSFQIPDQPWHSSYGPTLLRPQKPTLFDYNYNYQSQPDGRTSRPEGGKPQIERHFWTFDRRGSCVEVL